MTTRVDLTALTVEEVDQVFAQLGAGVPEAKVLGFVQERTRTRATTGLPDPRGAFDLSHLQPTCPDSAFLGW